MIKEKSVPMEIALLRKVNETRHAGVVTLLEWFECSDCFLLVMARPTPVLDLFDYVSEKKRLDENTSKMIFVQVVEAMIHCHQRSVLHRDIKLENILVKTDTLISTIIDFGCGTHLHSNLYKDFAGTPQYYPPEYYICKQYHGLPAAVWSVGVMLYAMLCGRLPFASAHEIVHLEPSWHGSFCRKISPAAKDLVEHMLKKQPRRRLQMQEILKHRWLKNAKYDSATGNVTVMTDDNTIVSNNGNQFQETLVNKGSVNHGGPTITQLN
jgi:serine/threonine protein kinase